MPRIVHSATKKSSQDARWQTLHIQDHIDKPVRGRSRETTLSCIDLRLRRYQIGPVYTWSTIGCGYCALEVPTLEGQPSENLSSSKITIGDAFDFKVQRAYFADEIVTKKFCGIEKHTLRKASRPAAAAIRSARPHTTRHSTV